MARPAVPARAISPNQLPKLGGTACGAAAGAAGKASAIGRTAGVAAAQVGGTDSEPIALASPNSAETIGLTTFAVVIGPDGVVVCITICGEVPVESQSLTMSSV